MPSVQHDDRACAHSGEPVAPADPITELLGVAAVRALPRMPPDDAPFPRAVRDSAGCERGAGWRGSYVEDTNRLLELCGHDTGMRGYVMGEHGTTGRGDVYSVTLAGRSCYRFLVSVTGLVRELTIAVVKPDGEVIARERYADRVAVFPRDVPYCVEDDQAIRVVVAMSHATDGAYGFAIVHRPMR